jgi:flagellar biosynthesis/type III secretory pathway protein FliH
MLTLDTHLAGVTADHPHPASYRPDLPLRGEFQGDADEESAADEAREEGRESGYATGYAEGKEDGRGESVDLAQKELAETVTSIDAALSDIRRLRDQLEEKIA